MGRPGAFGHRRIIVLLRPAARCQPRRHPGNIEGIGSPSNPEGSNRAITQYRHT